MLQILHVALSTRWWPGHGTQCILPSDMYIRECCAWPHPLCTLPHMPHSSPHHS
jgi:hypothetical protein